MRVDAALLLAAALIASPVSAMARNGKNEAAHTSSAPYAISNSSAIASHPSPRLSSKSTTSPLISSSHNSVIGSKSSIQIPSSVTSLTTSSTTTLTTTSTTTPATTSTTHSNTSISSDAPSSSQVSSSRSSRSSPTLPATHSTSSHATTHRPKTPIQKTTSHESTPIPVSLSNATSINSSNTTTTASMATTTVQTSTHAYTQTTDPALPPNLPPGYTITRLPCNTTTASRTATRTSTHTASRNGTQTHGQPRCKNGTRITIVPVCTPLPSSKTFTRYLIVHTSTVTFKGHKSDYKAPYAPIATPNYCDPNLYPAVPRPPPPGSTPEGFLGTISMITETFTIEGQSLTAEFPVPLYTAIAHVPVTTFITTDKNPSVVFSSDPIPNYSQTWSAGGGDGVRTPVDGGDGGHTAVGGGDGGHTAGGGGGGGQTAVGGGDGVHTPLGPDAPSYTITAGPTSVMINEQTFTVAPGSSTIVTANDNGVFTINPTAVIGQGVTVTRPPSVMGPSSAVLDGIPVTSAGPSLEIGGGAFAIPTSDSSTVRVNGKAVTINPTGVTIGGESMGFVKPAPSDVVVAGGEMLTAIGRSVVVLHSITYTYGTGIAPVVQVVNGDTVAIGPTGVLVHGSTLGGMSADPTETEFEIVGGATIAKIPPSMVIVNGETYAVGPGASMRTVVIGDQTLTMGPIGLVMASTTMKFPFDASVTTTIVGRSTGETMPQETGSKGEEDAAYSIRPDVRVGLTCLCIVLGVLVLG